MCPCLSSKSKNATCGRFTDGLMAPSIFERENYCFSLYELCPFFSGAPINDEEVLIESSPEQTP